MRLFLLPATCYLLTSVTLATDSATPDHVQISCDGSYTKKIVYTYSGKRPSTHVINSQPLHYEVEAQHTIHGVLTQNIRIDGTGGGGCFELFIRFRSVYWSCYNISDELLSIVGAQ